MLLRVCCKPVTLRDFSVHKRPRVPPLDSPVLCMWNISRFINIEFDQDVPHVHRLRIRRFVVTFPGMCVCASCSSFVTTCYRMAVVLC